MALEHGLTGAAAEIYQRLADALEHTGDYAAAKETYDEAFSFCSTNALEPTAQLCLACLTAVLRQSGDWDRATVLCRQVIASTEATMHARAVATGMLGSILGMRGQSKRASTIAARVVDPRPRDRVGVRWSCCAPGVWRLSISWMGLANRLLATAGRFSSDGSRPRIFITQSRRCAGRPLFAESGNGAEARTQCRGAGPDCRRLWSARGDVGVVACACETALLDGSADQAAGHFAKALSLLPSGDSPLTARSLSAAPLPP